MVAQERRHHFMAQDKKENFSLEAPFPQQLVSFRDLLLRKERFLVLPSYQRQFVWNLQQRQDLAQRPPWRSGRPSHEIGGKTYTDGQLRSCRKYTTDVLLHGLSLLLCHAEALRCGGRHTTCGGTLSHRKCQLSPVPPQTKRATRITPDGSPVVRWDYRYSALRA